MVTLTRPEGSRPEDFHHSRRALGGLFFAGYALAALAANAEPIHTDETGLVTAEVTYASPAGGQLPAYVARPAGKGPHAAVLVVSEIFGIHEYIRDTCRRLAKLGYVAIAPAFFFRAGDPAPLTDMAAIMKIVATANNDQVMTDVGATLDWLGHQPFVDKRRVAITGFCWGGAVVWMASAKYPQIRAGTAWYGHLTGPATRPWPIDVVKDLHAPILALYGGQDKGIPQTDVDKMRDALKASGKTAELHTYPEAQHGFHADYRPSYDAAAAQDGWKRMLAWFAANGVAPT